MTVTNFTIEYDSINSKSTFTNGDTINGRIIVEVSKDTTINSLVFIGKGEARVRWREQHGQNHHHVYWQNEKYYEVQHFLVRATRQDGKVFLTSVHFILCCRSGSTRQTISAFFQLPGTEVIKKGRNVFPFSFQIPDRCTLLVLCPSLIHTLGALFK